MRRLQLKGNQTELLISQYFYLIEFTIQKTVLLNINKLDTYFNKADSILKTQLCGNVSYYVYAILVREEKH